MTDLKQLLNSAWCHSVWKHTSYENLLAILSLLKTIAPITVSEDKSDSGEIKFEYYHVKGRTWPLLKIVIDINDDSKECYMNIAQIPK